VRGGKEPDILPRVEIELYGKLGYSLRREAAPDLLEVGIALPAYSGQAPGVARVESDQIAAAAVIRPKYQAMRVEQLKSDADIGRTQIGAVLSDDNNLLVVQLD
jgi:hypothetical protein